MVVTYLSWFAVIVIATLFVPAFASSITPEVDPNILIGIGTSVGAVFTARSMYLNKLKTKK